MEKARNELKACQAQHTFDKYNIYLSRGSLHADYEPTQTNSNAAARPLDSKTSVALLYYKC